MSTATEEEMRDSSTPRNLIRDLRRRKVFRVMAAYGVGAWLILQIIDVLSGAFPLPDWTVAVTSILLALGFPVAAGLSWAFQITPEGVIVDVDQARPLTANRSRLIHFVDVIIICVLLVVVAYLSFGDRFARTDSDEIRVAVLPFENLSDDESVTYLSEGIADDIRARLYEVPQLLLAARSSSASIFGKGLDIKTIGERLTVEHVLEGTIRKSGDRIRVTVQLVEVSTGLVRWVKTYNTRLDDVLEMQNNISLVVVSQLEVYLSKDIRQVLARKPTDDPIAYDFYLQAKGYLNRPRTKSNLDSALSLFESAINQDPMFALGYAGLCRTYIARYYDSSDVANVASAETNCQQAISLDPAQGEIHTALGQLYVSVSRWDEAESAFRKAIDLDARNIEAFTGMGDIFAARERYVEAEERYNMAIDILPANWTGYTKLAYFLVLQGRLEEAAANYQRVVEFTPDNPNAYNNLGVVYYLLGDFESAAMSYRRSLDLDPRRSAYSNTGTMYYFAADYEQAAEMFQKAVGEAGADYRLWGNLGDAQRFIDDRSDLARNSYRKAIELAMTEISVSAAKADDWTNLAWYHVNLGENEIAERYLESAASLPNHTAQQYYTTALVYTLLGNANLAEEAILKAKSGGLPQAMVDATPELAGPGTDNL